MAGIYLHIPFCKSKCPYCNFFSVASLSSKTAFVEALLLEMDLQRNYLGGRLVSTIYFGGGTPSVLEATELCLILSKLNETFSISPDAEITIEVNPDDVTAQNLESWLHTGINRLSIGVQSFSDKDLKYLGRIHSGKQSELALKLALEKGFSDLSADFIFGLPGQSDDDFAINLERAVNLGIPHISAYSLTVEPDTAMAVMIRKGLLQEPDDEEQSRKFSFLMEYLRSRGYEHYEISNFCLPGYYSKHNSSYWTAEHYLGLGPSAHSFNGASRQWNVSGISKYCRQLSQGMDFFESEVLSQGQKYNEYVMVSLRTMWGSHINHIATEFGEDMASYFIIRARAYIITGDMIENNGIYTLSDQGKLFADKISSDLFLDIS
ncbi:MAG: radical SAM family heme chaperone HemW [Bacteroidota bacterium]